MGRFVGYMNQRGKQSGGSGTIVGTEAYTRSSGITTSTDNNVNNLVIGENRYNSIQYNNVGLITGYNEIIGTTEKG